MKVNNYYRKIYNKIIKITIFKGYSGKNNQVRHKNFLNLKFSKRDKIIYISRVIILAQNKIR